MTDAMTKVARTGVGPGSRDLASRRHVYQLPVETNNLTWKVNVTLQSEMNWQKVCQGVWLEWGKVLTNRW